MKPATSVTIALLALSVLAAIGGYWVGRTGAGHDNAKALVPASAPTKDAAKQVRKLLYYRNPMGLPDTSPVPKKDPMGMDYIAVYEGEDDGAPTASGQIAINTEKIQKLGVRSEPAQLRALDKIVRAAGRIELDERRTYTIAPKFEGYIERLHVNATGQSVVIGQPLFEVYSPELVSAQREYLIAAQGVQALKDADSEAQRGMQQLAEASLARLKNWDISAEQVKRLTSRAEATRTLTFGSPVSGIVTEKKALQGMRFMPGEALYQVADLSSVWVIADVFEQDIGLIKPGQKAQVKINAYPDQLFAGVISYVYPTLKTDTRTIQVRIELPNPGQRLKPGMFAQVEMAVAAPRRVVTVPVSAVIDSGTRRMVLVQLKAGRFEPREVTLGTRSDDYVEVLSGVKDGESVVVAANFLIDAESNLKAVVSGFGQAAPESGKSATVTATSKAVTAGITHHADGSIEGIDAKAGTLEIKHGPVASLKWPTMTMQFKFANPALAAGLKKGDAIRFEFVERGMGEWVVTGIKVTTPRQPQHLGH